MEGRAIVIEQGFTTADVKTLEDCDHAEALLNESISFMESQLNDVDYVAAQPLSWGRRVRSALRFKRVARQIVAQRRSTLRHEFAHSWEQKFVEAVRLDYPNIYNEVSRTITT